LIFAGAHRINGALEAKFISSKYFQAPVVEICVGVVVSRPVVSQSKDQIHEEGNKFTSKLRPTMRSAVIYGGIDFQLQRKALSEGVHWCLGSKIWKLNNALIGLAKGRIHRKPWFFAIKYGAFP
jgi:hypothetical protein